MINSKGEGVISMNEDQKKQFIQATTLIYEGLSRLEDMYFEYDEFDELNTFQSEKTDEIIKLEQKWIPKVPLTLENAPTVICYLKKSRKMMTEYDEYEKTGNLIRSLEKFISSGEISDKDKEDAEICFHYDTISEIRSSVHRALVGKLVSHN